MVMAQIALHDALIARALELAALAGLPWVRTIQFSDAPGSEPDDPPELARFFAPLRGGKWVVVEEATGHGHALTQAKLVSGIEVIAGCYPTVLLPLLGHERALLASDGDALLQCALFGTWEYRPRVSERPTLRRGGPVVAEAIAFAQAELIASGGVHRSRLFQALLAEGYLDSNGGVL